MSNLISIETSQVGAALNSHENEPIYEDSDSWQNMPLQDRPFSDQRVTTPEVETQDLSMPTPPLISFDDPEFGQQSPPPATSSQHLSAQFGNDSLPSYRQYGNHAFENAVNRTQRRQRFCPGKFQITSWYILNTFSNVTPIQT